MKIHRWTRSFPNFGDDANLFLWDHFMPEVVAADDGALLVGIGTVLSAGLPAGRPRTILGSGAGYSAIPTDFEHENWRIYALRGPLTAKLIGANADLAALDPAALLPLMPEFESSRREGRIFVPHWTTAAKSEWRLAASGAGIEFVDPRQDAKHVINRIAQAEVVLAESMHAAIVADAFRVPWIPVVCTHSTPFKWCDWAHSLDMEYRPLHLGPLATLQSAAQHQMPSYETRSRFKKSDASNKSRSTTSNIRSLLGDTARWLASNIPEHIMSRLLAKELCTALRAKPTLSSESVLHRQQSKLLRAIETLRDDYAAGRVVTHA